MARIILLFCISIILGGCNTMVPALSVSEEETVESFPVKGRQGLLINQKLQFGDYSTSRVKRSWTRGGNTRIDIPFGTVANEDYPNLIGMDYVSKDQSFNFQMNDIKGYNSDVYGSSQFRSRDLLIGDNPNSVVNVLQDIFGKTDFSENIFYMQLFLNDQREPWQLLIDNHASEFFAKEYQGIFALNRDTYYTLKPITKLLGKNGSVNEIFGSVGFEVFDTQDRLVGAVSLVDNGQVYFTTKDAKERFILANLFSALLLQQDVSEQ